MVETMVEPIGAALVPQTPLIDVQQLVVTFETPRGDAHAVRGVSFSIGRGETVGVVGESGSGKSVTAMSLLQLLPVGSADVRANALNVMGRDVLRARNRELSELRGGEVGVVFQDPFRGLTPTMRIGEQIAEVIRRHRRTSRDEAWQLASTVLDRVGIPDVTRSARKYPHQFSGGQRQRIMIAIATACSPKFLIADEPTTALDVTTRAQILDLLLELRREMAMSLLLITHDISVIARVCDRVLGCMADESWRTARRARSSGRHSTRIQPPCSHPRHVSTSPTNRSGRSRANRWTPMTRSRVARLRPDARSRSASARRGRS